ncbi:hypothetical protein [Synechococcus sp. PCC 6312]|nr:hypothetical protein [Synechococcus sp. PCC 6312]
MAKSIVQQSKQNFLLNITALGQSGQSNISESGEEILRHMK